MIFRLIIFYIFLLFLPFQNVFAQENSSEEEGEATKEKIDTVVIYKEPVVVRKEVYVNPSEGAKADSGFEKGAEIFIMPLKNFNYYANCPLAREYFSKFDQSVSPVVSFSFGGRFYLLKKWLYLSSDLSYTTMRERFAFKSSSEQFDVINTLAYGEASLSAGYAKKSRNFLFILSSGGMLSKMLAYKGKILSYESKGNSVEDLQKRIYNDYIFSIIAAFKVAYNMSGMTRLFVEPSYRGDLTSVVSRPGPYVQQRNSVGVRLGLTFKF
jgi:hypothetical protein